MRVVIDTNVVVSALLSDRTIPIQVLRMCVTHHEMYASPSSLGELSDVLSRPKIVKRAFPGLLEFIREEYVSRTTIVSIGNLIPYCRDPRDDHLLALALACQADYLVTGDLDLLALDPFGKTRIVTPGDFLALTA